MPGDLEGIAVADPDSDFVYLGVEHPDSVREFNIATGLITRSFNLTPWLTGPTNAGLEALTFVPDTNHAEGRTVLRRASRRWPHLYIRAADRFERDRDKRLHIGTIRPLAGLTDIAGLHYDRANDVLYAAFDSA